ncbi:hypothetical protein ACOYR1_15995 [Thalassotalea piscium]
MILSEEHMQEIEKNIAKELTSEPEIEFARTDDELFKRANSAVNNQQGTKDLLALGMASIWVVFISIFTKILAPVFKQTSKKVNKTKLNATNNGNKQ